MSSATRIYLELDGRFYVYGAGRVTELTGLWDVTEEGMVVSDMPGSVSRVMQVPVEPKYAHFMARRGLEEEGEFDRPPALITHWREKRGKTDSEIFFTALPRHIYEHYLAHVHEASEPIIICCLYGALYELVKRYGKQCPVAVVFQRGRTADLVIGRGQRVYFANRSMVFDDTRERIRSLWDMVLSDIRAAEAENRIKTGKLVFVSWINSAPPPWEEDPGFQVEAFPGEKLDFEGYKYRASLFNALKTLSPAGSFSPIREKWAFRAKRAVAPLNVIVLICMILAFFGHLHFSNDARALESAYDRMARRLASVRQVQRLPKSISSYEDALSFVERLYRASRLPGCVEIVTELSGAFRGAAVVESLDVDYGESGVTAQVKGKIEAPFAEAHKEYLKALRVLQEKGYRIGDGSFVAGIGSSGFSLKFSKGIK